MQTALAYVAATLAEIGGCFAFWAWLRLGVVLLITFAYLLTRVDADAAGRTYAAYGGVYIVASVFWLWAIEGVRPDRWDVTGSVVCLASAVIILSGPRG